MSQSSTAQTRDVALASGETVLLRWAGATDTGRRRENNQDSFLAQFPLFVVADGMGGHAGGEIASQRTIARLEEAVAAGAVTAETIEAALIAAVDDITAHPETTDEGTGTTLTGVFFALVDGDARWVSLNIGDSRVYLLRDGALSQITTDHSVVQELITAGRLSPEEAEGHPYSNVITRAVGVSEALPPDYRELSVQDGDRFVICSDGLTKELTDYGIQHFLGLHPTADAAADAMMSAALENGGRDNVTLIVIDIARRGPGDESEETSSTAELPTE
ncbi:PP2C family serine/threonine-protein phosphatase [uncultured Microbacterium sp.]|uniref:PP2C family protein-serine/threonine phosphatase n=1 Tax=uncultured Microbacterium sp. TaxID=191216 RepID=UPI0025D5063E|nr:protein phosphatase 2C domain-containing protein [uncultured Microbacterium sp.]